MVQLLHTDSMSGRVHCSSALRLATMSLSSGQLGALSENDSASASSGTCCAVFRPAFVYSLSSCACQAVFGAHGVLSGR